MALRNWRRTTTDDGFVVGAAAGEHDGPSCTGDDLAARLGLVAAPEGDDADRARYQDWAGRMQDRRAEAQAAMRPTVDLHRTDNWNPDLLFSVSEDEPDDDTAPRPADIARIRAVLGVDEHATADEVTRAYRTLVKAHHPDRFATEPAEVQDEHATHLRRIVRAYERLNRLTSV